MRRFLKYLSVSLVVLLVGAWMVSGYVCTSYVTAPRPNAVEDQTEFAEKPIQDVSLTTEDGVNLAAWYIPNSPDNAVITLSGIGNDRRQMRRTAEAYAAWGFTLLMPDLRGTGESGGEYITIGWDERKDLIACVRWLKDKGYKCIGAHGFSLGAAAICFAFKDLPDLGFAVVESSYDTMRSATENRLARYHVPGFAAWPFQVYFGLWTGAGLNGVSPVKYMPYAKCPVLVLSGDSEGYLTKDETTSLFNACGSSKKRMHIFKGGRHKQSMSHFPEESRETIRKFLVEEVGLALP